MKINSRILLSAATGLLVLLIPSAAWAQAKHTHSAEKQAGMKSEMASMMTSPHHLLMSAHLKSMAGFATALRDQAVKPGTLNLEFARAAVAELRHSLDAMEAIHQEHMQSMNAEMKAGMQTMMAKMEKESSTVKDQVSALEADVAANTPESTQVAAHANALLKHFGMMAKRHSGKKMTMKKSTAMKM